VAPTDAFYDQVAADPLLRPARITVPE
jgi:hypothetical protein